MKVIEISPPVRNFDENIALPTLDRIPEYPIGYTLDGSQGRNRAPVERCKIDALHDYAAIQCWLQRYQHKDTTTHRNYKKEAERLLLWCLFKHKTALSSLTEADLMAYADFLGNPQPHELWCGKSGGKGHKRGMPGWKPFVKGLSGSSKRASFAILDSLFTFLFNARYLDFNPLALARFPFNRVESKEEKRHAIRQKVLAPVVWNSLIDTLDLLPVETAHEKNDAERVRWLVHLVFFLGVRNSVLKKNTFSAFERDEEGKWWFTFVGKGDKFGRVVVNDDLLNAMRRFRSHFRLSPLPEPHETTPLIPSWKSSSGVSPRQINNILKKLSGKTAELFPNQPLIAKKLQRFSAHWLRHQTTTMQSYAGIRQKHTQGHLGHSSVQTTELYDHTFDDAQHEDMQKLGIRFNLPIGKTTVENTGGRHRGGGIT
ncbi:MAG: tyrosine-type recombinase/integrase [Gammaproteobacteria bacterium]